MALVHCLEIVNCKFKNLKSGMFKGEIKENVDLITVTEKAIKSLFLFNLNEFYFCFCFTFLLPGQQCVPCVLSCISPFIQISDE